MSRLTAGLRLGPYEIVAPLGQGGMGEVYKARDSRLGRIVALKVLPEALANSAEARLRFEREARAISSLSHPHVCALHDIGEDGDVVFLVMELLDGETLASRIAKGPLAIAEVGRIGAEIAAALAAAHRLGIVHRDLKPANVMLTTAGAKLMDFGLARTVAAPSFGSRDDEATVSVAAPLTEKNVWLGTIPYMSPEQIQGKPADARSDVFAFGAVLYEMATGARAFSGDSALAIASAITQQAPPLLSSRVDGASALTPLVEACLIKDPEKRWQSAQDAVFALRALGDLPGRSEIAVPSSPSRRGAWVPWLLAAATLGGLITFLVGGRVAPAAPPESITLNLARPPQGRFFYSVETLSLAVSPDGRRLAFVVSDEESGARKIWLRSLTSTEAAPVAGTDGAQSVFWSSDGHSLGFVAGGALKRRDLDGGAAPVTLTSVPGAIGYSGTWGPSGEILFASIEGASINSIATSGGEAKTLIRPDAAAGEVRVLFPTFLPNSRRFVYISQLTDSHKWLVAAGDGRPPKRVREVDSNIGFAGADTLVFALSGTLMAQQFDPVREETLGDPVGIADTVRAFLSTASAAFAASPAGTIVYQPTGDLSRLKWVERGGREAGDIAAPGTYLDVRVGPDGRSATFSRMRSIGTYDVWSIDLARGTEQRLTPEDRDTEIGPVPVPGGPTMYYAWSHGQAPRVARRNLDTGQAEILFPGPTLQLVTDIAPDGSAVIFQDRAKQGPYNLFLLPLTGEPKPVLFRASSANETDARFSPDGRFISFVASEGGMSEVCVAPIGGGAKTVVSRGGGRSPRWSRDGRELIYLSADHRLISVPLRTSPTLSLGTPAALFALGGREWAYFDTAPDGRFLAIVLEQPANEQPLTAILNWSAASSRAR